MALVPVALVAFTLRAWAVGSAYPACPGIPPADPDLACYGRDVDAAYATAQAAAVAEGRGLVAPASLAGAPGARIGPAVPLVGAAGRFVGFGDAGGDRVLPLVVGSLATIGVGLVTWTIADASRRTPLRGRIAGPVAAMLAALWPGFWANEALGRPDAGLVPVATVVVWLLHRWWRAPSTGRAVAAGLAAGAFTLVRVDGLLVAAVAAGAVLVVGPVVPFTRRLVPAAALLGAALAVVAPWSLWASVSFGEPVLLGTGIGRAVAEATCDRTFSGPALGSRDPLCLPAALRTGGADEVLEDQQAWDAVWAHLGDDAGRLVVVVPARVARLWGAYGTADSVYYDRRVEAKGDAAPLGWIALWATLPLFVAGLVGLRRRGVALAPLLVLPVAATIAAMATGGVTRLRIGADVAVVVAAGLGTAAVVAWLAGRRSGAGEEPEVVAGG